MGESERRYRSLFDGMTEGFAIHEIITDVSGRPLDYRFLDINAAFERLTGLKRADVVGRTHNEVLPDDDPKWVRMYGQVALTGEPVQFENYSPALQRHYEVYAYQPAAPICRDLHGCHPGKQAQEAMRFRDEQFTSLIAHLHSRVALIDEHGRFTICNAAFLNIFGLTSHVEDINSLDWQRWQVFDEDGKLLNLNDHPIRMAAASGKPVRDRLVRVKRPSDARDVWLLVNAQPILKPDGTLQLLVCTYYDITERMQAEEELKAAKVSAEQAKAAAEAASKAKDHFLAVLSHELRNPLNPVLATATMLQKDPRFDADTREQLEIICRNAELEARLIDDLLDVTRIEQGKVELDRRPVELCTVLRRAAEVCMPDVEARKLEFGINLGPDAPYWIDADAGRLQQVFWNLLRNSIKFTPPGGCVGIRCRPDGDGFVDVQVNDSGIGIEPEALTRLFNAFEQAERSITRRFGGLGLGLTISKALVEMHGGSITATSQGKDKGATFTVRLPRLPLRGYSSATPSSSQSPVPPAAARPRRILLVEDHGDTARVMRRLLMADGHEVHTAADVATAIKLATAQPFDLLLSDLGLPDGSGLDLMRPPRAAASRFPASPSAASARSRTSNKVARPASPPTSSSP